MPKIKGTGFDAMRRVLNKQSETFKQEYLASLTPEERYNVEKSVAVSWVNLELDKDKNSLMILANKLYPHDHKCLQKLGLQMAKEGLPRFYQIFMRIPTVEFVMKRAARIWGSYYDKGDADIEEYKGQTFNFVLRGFPEFPDYMREYMAGFLKGVGEILQLKNAMVIKIENDPNVWKWKVRWDK